MTPLERINLSNQLAKLSVALKDGSISGFERINKRREAEEIVTLLNGPNYKIFPKSELTQAFSHSSRQPEKIAEGLQSQYFDVITKAIEKAKPEIQTPEQQAAFDQASKELQEKYIAKVKVLAAARSGVVSSFIAGKSNFNSKQANKRGNSYDKVALDFENWIENVAQNYIWQAVREAMSKEQRQAELELKQKEKEEKQKAKLEADAKSLWRIIEPKKFPMDYSSNMLITRVSFNKEKIPSSITIATKNGEYLTDDKIVLNKIFKNMDEILNYLKEQGKKIPTSWSETNIGS